MIMTEVWRLETSCGEGPFITDLARTMRAATGHNPYHGPDPMMDGLDCFVPLYKFGTRDPEELIWWFSCKGLRWAGVSGEGRVVRYTVPADATMEGSRQIAFDATIAEIAEVYCPADFARDHCSDGCCNN